MNEESNQPERYPVYLLAERMTKEALKRLDKFPKTRRNGLTKKLEKDHLELSQSLRRAVLFKSDRTKELEESLRRIENLKELWLISRESGYCSHQSWNVLFRLLNEVGRNTYGWLSAQDRNEGGNISLPR